MRITKNLFGNFSDKLISSENICAAEVIRLSHNYNPTIVFSDELHNVIVR